MKFIEVVICAVLISFMAGLFYATEYRSRQPDNVKKQKVDVEKSTLDEIVDSIPLEAKLEPCSKTTMMPCEVSPKDPVRENLNDRPQKEGLFVKGEKVTCIYNGVFWWDNKDEFMKTVGMACKVVEASEEYTDLEPGYQQLKVNCKKGLEKMWSDQPGAGMVKGHKLNFVERWFPSTDCYHFQSEV